MRAFLASLLIIGVLLCASQSLAQAPALVVPGVKGARHVILPYIGYQMINGEKVGYKYSDLYFDYVTNLLATKDTSYSSESDDSTPELGLSYRYLASDLVTVEVMLSVLENKTDLEYPVTYNASYYTQRSKVSISKGNTVKLAGGALFNLPSPIKWLSPTARLAVGYAWRDVNVKSSRRTETVSTYAAADMYVIQGGVDVSVWSKENMLIEGSLFYTHYIPTDSDIDAFGGLGWGIRVFPIWSNSRK